MVDRKMIYLNDAINALECRKDKKTKGDIGGFYNKIIQNDIDALMQLPSAEPERQVELDGTESNIEILSELRAQFNCFDEVEEPCYRALSDAICALSAQPQRMRFVQQAVNTIMHIARSDSIKDKSFRNAARMIQNAIDGEPQDFEPIPDEPEWKTGRWQEDPSGYGFWICSACRFVSEASCADLLYNFCPNCGADMRGKTNGNN